MDSVFESAATRLSQDRAVFKNNINAVNASRTDRAKEREKVSESITSISSHINDARTKFGKELDESHSILDESIDEASENIFREVAATIDKVRQVKNLAAQAHWSLQHELHRERARLAKDIRKLVNRIETVLNDTENELSGSILASGLSERPPRTHLLPVSARTICKDAEAILIENLDVVL